MKKTITKDLKHNLTKDAKIKIKHDYSVKSQILHKLDKNPHKENWTNRILIGLPTTGLVRTEWMMAKYGQVIPTNWSQVEMTQWMSTYAPLEYQLPDAENLMAKEVVEGNFEWFLSIESDNVIPPNTYITLNEYMTEKKVPIISGLYYTKSVPAEPILYRGRGNGSFRDFKLGDKVWCDGIPFGLTLIHGSIIRALWNESEEYKVGDITTRRVFELPSYSRKNYGFDNTSSETDIGERSEYTVGTTDLNFCTRLMRDGIFAKAGWPEYQDMKYPFLVDTNLFVQHIDNAGRMWPLGGVPLKNKPIKGIKPREIK